jgi:hypothetical protein
MTLTKASRFSEKAARQAWATKQETKKETTRNWRRKPLKSLKTDSELAPAGSAPQARKSCVKAHLSHWNPSGA